MSITNYSQLQNAVAEWLVRSDLPAIIPTFIANAEATFRRDPRIRQLAIASFPITTASQGLPDDFKRLESISLTGPSPFRWELDIVSPGDLSKWSGVDGIPRAPRAAALVESNTTVLFSPAPNQTYQAQLAYWRDVPALTDQAPSNWLLGRHPDIYLYGTLVESAPYLRDDERVALWRSEYERRVQELDAFADQYQFSGSLSSGITPIG